MLTLGAIGLIIAWVIGVILELVSGGMWRGNRENFMKYYRLNPIGSYIKPQALAHSNCLIIKLYLVKICVAIFSLATPKVATSDTANMDRQKPSLWERLEREAIINPDSETVVVNDHLIKRLETGSWKHTTMIIDSFNFSARRPLQGKTAFSPSSLKAQLRRAELEIKLLYEGEKSVQKHNYCLLSALLRNNATKKPIDCDITQPLIHPKGVND